jgi:hypothetical protein
MISSSLMLRMITLFPIGGEAPMPTLPLLHPCLERAD